MCMDVNGKIKPETYLTPNIEMLFAKLKNANKFSKLDLTSAYWQIVGRKCQSALHH